MNAKDFLETKGIKLETTTLISCIENAMRQPDLISLMEEYANVKVMQHKTVTVLTLLESLDRQLKK